MKLNKLMVIHDDIFKRMVANHINQFYNSAILRSRRFACFPQNAKLIEHQKEFFVLTNLVQ